LGVTSEPDLTYLTITEGGTERTVRARRPALANRVRVCRVRGREPGLDIHGQNADLLLAFDDRGTRDRVAATLR